MIDTERWAGLIDWCHLVWSIDSPTLDKTTTRFMFGVKFRQQGYAKIVFVNTKKQGPLGVKFSYQIGTQHGEL